MASRMFSVLLEDLNGVKPYFPCVSNSFSAGRRAVENRNSQMMAK